jgi:transposase
MRGDDLNQAEMFSYLSAEDRVPQDHPLRGIQRMCDEVLRGLSRRFSELYSPLGRPSIAPEKLLRALLLQILYSVRSERMLMEQLDYNLLFRWFVGLNMDEPVWNPTVFSKNRDRLLEGDIAQAFFAGVLQQARQRDLLSDEHFTVDGTLLQAWASRKSYQKKDDPPQNGTGSRGNTLRRDTHESKTDPEAVMYRKSAAGAFQLSHMAHVVIENRHGLPVAGMVTAPSPQAEREAALDMLKRITAGNRQATVGADKAYDDARFVSGARALHITPHVHQYEGRASHIDKRTTRHAGYGISLKKRRLVEQIFGWVKTTALLRQVRHRGQARIEWIYTLALSAYSLVRMENIRSVQTA